MRRTPTAPREGAAKWARANGRCNDEQEGTTGASNTRQTRSLLAGDTASMGYSARIRRPHRTSYGSLSHMFPYSVPAGSAAGRRIPRCMLWHRPRPAARRSWRCLPVHRHPPRSRAPVRGSDCRHLPVREAACTAGGGVCLFVRLVCCAARQARPHRLCVLLLVLSRLLRVAPSLSVRWPPPCDGPPLVAPSPFYLCVCTHAACGSRL